MYIIFFALSFTLRHPPTFCRSPSTTIRFAVIRPPPPSAILSFALRYSVFRQNATHHTLRHSVIRHPTTSDILSFDLRHSGIRPPPHSATPSFALPLWHSSSAILRHSVIRLSPPSNIRSRPFCHPPSATLLHSGIRPPPMPKTFRYISYVRG